jgi:predicted phosphoribosyltransferase
LDAHGKIAVLIDDGLATGQTCRAALKWIRGLGPSKLLLAVPCASATGVDEVRRYCDGIVTLAPPDPFFTAVGAYYEDFEQVSSDEAKRTLLEANNRFLGKVA